MAKTFITNQNLVQMVQVYMSSVWCCRFESNAPTTENMSEMAEKLQDALPDHGIIIPPRSQTSSQMAFLTIHQDFLVLGRLKQL